MYIVTVFSINVVMLLLLLVVVVIVNFVVVILLLLLKVLLIHALTSMSNKGTKTFTYQLGMRIFKSFSLKINQCPGCKELFLTSPLTNRL